MKILGISGSPRKGSTTDQLVKEVLSAATGCQTEFISLAGMKIGPCVGCLGCVETNICVLNDDMVPLRQKIVEADAYVIGGANYFSTLNGLTHCFMERWYQFRHREGATLTGKPAVAVGVGGGSPKPVIDNIRTFFKYNQIECIGDVDAMGSPCCFSCGYGETCKVGAIHMFFGPGTKITPEITPNLSKQPDKIKLARDLGRKLAQHLKDIKQAN